MMNNSAITLYSYQQKWLKDNSRFKVGMFARQTGKTFTTETIAAARGVDVNVLRQKAYKKAIKFEKLSAYAAGVRQRLTDLVDNAVSVDELDKIVIEFSLLQGGM